MKFTPELPLKEGRIKPLHHDDVDSLFRLYQTPEIPGQRPLDNKDPLFRMIDLSVQMAATQRGMMWAIEIDGDIRGMVSGYDWQPSLLRIMMRVDALPSLTEAQREEALRVSMNFLSEKYHLRNFGYQWIDGQKEEIKTSLENVGFKPCAILRDAWLAGEKYSNVHQYHFLSDQNKPVPKRLGDDDDVGQNLNASHRGVN